MNFKIRFHILIAIMWNNYISLMQQRYHFKYLQNI